MPTMSSPGETARRGALPTARRHRP
jgi:hypothetical protein